MFLSDSLTISGSTEGSLSAKTIWGALRGKSNIVSNFLEQILFNTKICRFEQTSLYLLINLINYYTVIYLMYFLFHPYRFRNIQSAPLSNRKQNGRCSTFDIYSVLSIKYRLLNYNK